jgi:hypothetical protein
MRKRQKEIEELHSEMVNAIQKDIDKQKLAADLLLQRLFKIADLIKRTPEIIGKARERVELGNPPGKKGSIGDAVNWESLLSSVPNHVKFIVIADDSDFFSPLNTNRVNEFLFDEWVTRKKSKPQFYRKLSSFFKEHYPTISLKTEQEKDGLIERLAASSNFAATHSLIAQLSKYDGFTQKQVEDLVNALKMNNQVLWIIDDEDVHAFYKNIYDKYFFSLIDQSDELEKLLASPKAPPDSDDEIPF